MVKEKLVQALRAALEGANQAGTLDFEDLPELSLEKPPNKSFGDFSCNIAMVLAKQLHLPPRQVAQAIIDRIELPPGLVSKLEVAGAGFLNFHLRPDWLQKAIRQVHRQGEEYGHSDLGEGKRVQVEFVSANPNGPLSVGNGRGGVIGDVLANLLTAVGYQVEREFYVNDAATSTQMRKFGESLDARYQQVLGREASVPEDGYQGEYVLEIAREIAYRQGDSYLDLPPEERIAKFTTLAQEEILKQQKADLAAFGIRFDVWFRESGLFESGEVEAGIEKLRQAEFAYEADGAIWFKSTQFGDDKDRPLVRSNGKPTYLAADVAYHLNKFQRGFEKLIDIWGPDHHGYVARTKAAVQALGYRPEQLDILIYQIVRLFSGGELVKMSKRAGELVRLSEVVDEVGKDAARFFFLMRHSDSHLDFDLELAKQESPENPVYYVQYAHARICSILAEAEKASLLLPDPAKADLSLLQTEDELELMRRIADLPEEIATAASLHEPHRLTRYAQDLGAIFHSFYTNCRVLSDDPELTGARLVLVEAARITLRNVLSLMGLSAPERM